MFGPTAACCPRNADNTFIVLRCSVLQSRRLWLIVCNLLPKAPVRSITGTEPPRTALGCSNPDITGVGADRDSATLPDLMVGEPAAYANRFTRTKGHRAELCRFTTSPISKDQA